MSKKRPLQLHTCRECANVTPVLSPHHLLSVKGEPTLGTCPFWTESRCILLNWKSTCPHFKPLKP